MQGSCKVRAGWAVGSLVGRSDVGEGKGKREHHGKGRDGSPKARRPKLPGLH